MKREPAPLTLHGGKPAQAPWVRVCLSRVRGSAPREQGACMLVGATQTSGSIGGGHLEFKAIATARQLRARWSAGATAAPHVEIHVLGPRSGNAAVDRLSCATRLRPGGHPRHSGQGARSHRRLGRGAVASDGRQARGLSG